LTNQLLYYELSLFQHVVSISLFSVIFINMNTFICRSEMQRHRNYSTFLLHSTRVDRKSNSMSLEIVSHERKKCPTIELLQFEKVVIRTWPQWHFENNWLFRNKLFWNDRWMYFIL